MLYPDVDLVEISGLTLGKPAVNAGCNLGLSRTGFSHNHPKHFHAFGKEIMGKKKENIGQLPPIEGKLLLAIRSFPHSNPASTPQMHYSFGGVGRNDHASAVIQSTMLINHCKPLLFHQYSSAIVIVSHL